MRAHANYERVWRQAKDGDTSPAEWRDDWKPDLEREKDDTARRAELLRKATAEAAADVAVISSLADSAAVQGLANIVLRSPVRSPGRRESTLYELRSHCCLSALRLRVSR
jgi:hypothetical protein